MNTVQGFEFQMRAGAIAAAAAAVAIVVCVSYVTWSRRGRTWPVGLLELLRIGIVVTVLVLLAQPEWVQQANPSQRPAVVVLVDTSRSMETEDVAAATSGGESTALEPRRATAQRVLDDAPAWESLRTRFDVITEPFASAESTSSDGSNYSAAMQRALRKERNVRSVLIIGDGDYNEGPRPVETAAEFLVRDVPIFTVGVGRETPLPDLAIRELSLPAMTVVDQTLRVPYVLESTIGRDLQTTAVLRMSDGEVARQTIRIPAMGRYEGSFTWTPAETGDVTATLSVPVQRGESITDNNRLTVPIKVRRERIRILIIEAAPRWEIRYLKNAFERDPGVDVKVLLYHPQLGKMGGGKNYLKAFPETRDQLTQYDVVFVGDVGIEQLTLEQCKELKGLVEQQASGLVFLPGFSGRQATLAQSELADLLPVELDPTSPSGIGESELQPYALSEAGRESLLTRLVDDVDQNVDVWRALPGFHWHAAVTRARPGSEVLVVHGRRANQYGRVPLIATRPYGNGKVLFMATDAAWRWRRGVEDRYHYRFWSQVARWMAYQRHMAKGERMRLFYSPDQPRQGTTVALQANVMDALGAPLQEGHVSVEVTAPDGTTETIRLKAATGTRWGLFAATFRPKQAGSYRLRLRCRETGDVLDATLFARGESRERVGRPANFDVMRELASVTGGRMVEAADFRQILDDLAALPPAERVARRVRLWCHPLTVGMLISLMGIFWIGRKMQGQI